MPFPLSHRTPPATRGGSLEVPATPPSLAPCVLSQPHQREVCLVLWLAALHTPADRGHCGPRELCALPYPEGGRGGPGGCEGADCPVRGRGEWTPGECPDPAGGWHRPQRKPAPSQHARVPRLSGGQGRHPEGPHQVSAAKARPPVPPMGPQRARHTAAGFCSLALALCCVYLLFSLSQIRRVKRVCLLCSSF